MRKCFWMAILLFAAAVHAWAGDPAVVPLAIFQARQPGEILVQLRPEAQPGADMQTAIPALRVMRVKIHPGITAQGLAESLKTRPDIVWVQPNYWRHTLATDVVPNDPYYLPTRNQRRYQQWYLLRINANFAWSQAEGSDTFIVAVVDTGVDLNHPDLKSRLLPGVTIVNQDKYTPPANGQDDEGHGSHVSGLIGAATNNGVGMAGCSWAGKILPVKVLNSNGEGTDLDIAAGIMYAADAGARVINLSLGGPNDGGPPPVLQAAVDYAYGKGCLLIAASGNSGDNTVYYPAALPHVLAVAATDAFDRVTGYSTFGPFVALAAPGGAGVATLTAATDILSTFWDGNSGITDNAGGAEAGEYAIAAGTSMAAGLVSGAAAVIWGQNPGYTADQVGNLLKATAADIGPPGPDQYTGAGRIDLLAALGNSPVSQPALTLYNFPNPFNPDAVGTQIVFLLDQPAEIHVKIFDMGRDLVWEKTLTAAQTLAGKNMVLWDGRNGVGERVANGAYYMRVTTADGRASQIKVIAVMR